MKLLYDGHKDSFVDEVNLVMILELFLGEIEEQLIVDIAFKRGKSEAILDASC